MNNEEPGKQEPEPDHKEVRRRAEFTIERLGLSPPDPGFSLVEDARAYLALSDELAALNEKVGMVPHLFFSGGGGPGYLIARDKTNPSHDRMLCMAQGGACVFGETSDA